jgi:hypothetical protein
MAYDYKEAMADDIKQYIDENVTIDENGYTYNGETYEDGQSLYEALNDDMWVEDSVTGNGSGSYTFDRHQSYENVQGDPDAMDYIRDLVSEFGVEAETVAEKFLDEDYDYWDVSIRCYLLGEVLSTVFEEMGIDY